jgi:hypothetical protein
VRRGFDELEHALSAELHRLLRLPEDRPSAAALARVQAAVAAEVARRQTGARLWRAVRGVCGIAAAVLLAAGWTLVSGRGAGSAAAATDSAVMNEWVNAADASGRVVTRLIDTEGAALDEPALGAEPIEPEAELDDWLDSFEDLQEIGA